MSYIQLHLKITENSTFHLIEKTVFKQRFTTSAYEIHMKYKKREVEKDIRIIQHNPLIKEMSSQIQWRRKWQPTPVFLPRESRGQRSLMGCGPQGRTESDTTDVTQQQQQDSEIAFFPCANEKQSIVFAARTRTSKPTAWDLTSDKPGCQSELLGSFKCQFLHRYSRQQ